ncbi:MAG: hypothetical protein QM753_03340 [Thermomicrobiales bacterium]
MAQSRPFLELFSCFAETDPLWVVAELEPGMENYGTIYKEDGERSPEREPGVNAYLAYANGVRGFLSGWKSAAPAVRVVVQGPVGQIEIDGRLAVLRWLDGGTRPLLATGRVSGFQAALLDLIAGVETDRPVQSPPREARKTVALIEAILASQRQGNVKADIGPSPF